MAGQIENFSSTPQYSLSPPSPVLEIGSDRRYPGGYFRSVSENEVYTRRLVLGDSGEVDEAKWRTAMQCKLHVGTKEWVNCTKTACVGLRDELHHLLECPYKRIGGCTKRCDPLRKELRRFSQLHPKHPTFSYTQSGHRHHVRNVAQELTEAEGSQIQQKLEALTIEKFVVENAFSPSSPHLDEPIFEVGGNEGDTIVEELVSLDESVLSVVDGQFRRGFEWEKVGFLGTGSFGTTFQCYDKGKESYFAIKKLRETEFYDEEIEIWKMLNDDNHPNILRLYGAVKRMEKVLIFMEYMTGGSVGDYLATHGCLDEKAALIILQQVLYGLEFMHKNAIVHNDVKGANILMGELGLRVKLADFGSCINLRLTEKGLAPRLTGTLAFMAPEVCRSEVPSFSADMWSAMCFLLQMLTADAPWAEYRHQENTLNVYIIGSTRTGPLLPRCNALVSDLFSRGFHIEAKSRPTASELLKHQAFYFEDWPSEVTQKGEDEKHIENMPHSVPLDGLGGNIYATESARLRPTVPDTQCCTGNDRHDNSVVDDEIFSFSQSPADYVTDEIHGQLTAYDNPRTAALGEEPDSVYSALGDSLSAYHTFWLPFSPDVVPGGCFHAMSTTENFTSRAASLVKKCERDYSVSGDSSLEYHTFSSSLSSDRDFDGFRPVDSSVNKAERGNFFPNDSSLEYCTILSTSSFDADDISEDSSSASNRMDEKGGSLIHGDTCLSLPPDALENPITVCIRHLDPIEYHQHLINTHVYGVVKIIGYLRQFTPENQTFLKPASVEITVPEVTVDQEVLVVLYGTRDKRGITWTDLTQSAVINRYARSTEVRLNIDHFSYLMILKCYAAEYYSYCIQYVINTPRLFRFLVLMRTDEERSNVVHARLVMVREYFYRFSSSLDRDGSVWGRLQSEGFHLMFGGRRMYCSRTEELEVRLDTPFDVDTACGGNGVSQPYTVQGLFGGEVVAGWSVVCGGDTRVPFSGAVTIKRRHLGLRYCFQFWKSEPMQCIQDFFELPTLTFTNVVKIAKAMGISEEEIAILIKESAGNEEDQIRRLTERWNEKAEHGELRKFNDIVSQLSKKDIVVSRRGQFHLGHLLGFEENWAKLNERDQPGKSRDENFFKNMASSVNDICRSVFSDCLLQIHESSDHITLATNIRWSLEQVTNHVSENYSAWPKKYFDVLLAFYVENSDVVTGESRHFCNGFYACLPWVCQIVKDLYKPPTEKEPPGFWGIDTVTCTDNNNDDDDDLPSNKIWCDICEILQQVCKNNLKCDDDIDTMGNKLDVGGLLRLLERCIKGTEWGRLKARINYFQYSTKQITLNELSTIFRKDLQHVLMWLKQYVAFSPSHLVHFNPISHDAVTREPLHYDANSKTFSQKFTVSNIDQPAVVFSFSAIININGVCCSRNIDTRLPEREEKASDGGNVDCALSVCYKHNEDGIGELITTIGDLSERHEIMVTAEKEPQPEELKDARKYTRVTELNAGVFYKLCSQLNIPIEGRDWKALAGKMECRQKDVDTFELSQNPAEALLKYWGTKDGHGVEKLKEFLLEFGRDDILVNLKQV